jgi:hypothetical protein
MTIRFQEPQLQPYEDHSAWQSTWNADEELLAHATGYLDNLVDISLIKRVLQDETMPPGLRLRFLEILNKLVHGHLTLEAMQAVAPACDTAMKMLDEMKQLEIGDKLRLMSTWNVAAAFCNLNPSIIEAIKLFNFHQPSRERA